MLLNRCACSLSMPVLKLVTETRTNSFWWKSITRHMANFVRTPVRVYDPARGELSAKQSIAKLPASKKDAAKQLAAMTEIQKFAEAGEIFRKMMGDIHTSKNKRLIALEGGKLVEEALKYGLRLKTLFLLKSLKEFPERIKAIVDKQQNLEADSPSYESTSIREPEIIRIKQSTMELWSSVKTPPGIIGIFDRPTESYKAERTQSDVNDVQPEHAPVPLTVVLDNIREPGNLGSIIRTAAGIGCNVLLSKGCVDAWDMKALRGGDGAQLFVPMSADVDLETLYRVPQLSDLLTSNTQSIQNENNDTLVPSKVGIGIFLADSGCGSDKFGLPIAPYTSFKYSDFSWVILILGGETTGLSDTVRKEVVNLQKFYPDVIKTVSRVTIPMSKPIDSLNVANAFGIIGYEISRQYMT
ncbi:unnamed protein product [Orchesella dallaii]|uniref:tRNA/rRNA methyltransferase SpoU type domain-containing protein n=1 Tax=Orchesella dallaii TaxID=48710 RepID=A0ABP1PXN6_9HEXA